MINIFSGSRRIAIAFGGLWVFGWAIAALFNETTVRARYDFIVDSKFAQFIGFDLFSCPTKADQRSQEIKTTSGRTVQVTLCVFGSAKDLSKRFVVDNPAILLQDPRYIESDLATKRRLFDVYVAQSAEYMAANPATKQAIRNRFSVSEGEAIKEGAETRLPHPDNAKLVHSKTSMEGEDQEIDRLSTPVELGAPAGFKIRKEDEARLDERWWNTWISTYLNGVAIMLAGLASLWFSTFVTGWIVRGFLGVPVGKDYRQNL